jgi:hypothetical protein
VANSCCPKQRLLRQHRSLLENGRKRGIVINIVLVIVIYYCCYYHHVLLMVIPNCVVPLLLARRRRPNRAPSSRLADSGSFCFTPASSRAVLLPSGNAHATPTLTQPYAVPSNRMRTHYAVPSNRTRTTARAPTTPFPQTAHLLVQARTLPQSPDRYHLKACPPHLYTPRYLPTALQKDLMDCGPPNICMVYNTIYNISIHV